MMVVSLQIEVVVVVVVVCVRVCVHKRQCVHTFFPAHYYTALLV